ncbi:MAG: 2-succinyl-5-enolpyruvyl-6-hydroxy-3-cyclohexene-1-carboxylic-acid synthase [Flavobacteriaceae bacterium]|nr:2-succinyl-5-enolpyruvyl-6-hydroxy-3-cyclohexene-1-carboxylic-acid synthase [Flavobacteriaceae bacterium]
MNYSSKILSQLVVELCISKEIDHVVISPGSRNAPLIIGFTSQDFFKCYSIVDERCAAFFALGLAQQLQKPVAMVCSSGSASLNYYPAIAEAYYSNIPLVVITADRPSHLVDIGDGQTIRQEHVYANHIEYSANCKEGESYQEFNENEINRALNTAIERQGPVHINIPFSEPLYHRVAEKNINPISIAPNFIQDVVDAIQLKNLAEKWNGASKKMILVGSLFPNAIASKHLDSLANDTAVMVLTETTSNLHHANFFPAIDQLISSLLEEESKTFQPDILLTFGGMVVSKRIKAFLRKYSPKEHWHVGLKTANDTFFCLTEHIKNTPNTFLEHFLPLTVSSESNYQKLGLALKKTKLEKQLQFETNIPFSDFSVYHSIFKSIPDNTQLQLANSTAIRYAQLFPLASSLRVFCNRGTSGIDGSTSTAVGAAVAFQNPTVFITGDLSFFYDSNALWNKYILNSFRIIVVNNAGGGIFRILPNAKEVPHFEEFFETKHALTAEHLCAMFGFEYKSAWNMDSLENVLKSFYSEGNKPKLLEIFTPSKINDEVLKNYFTAIS